MPTFNSELKGACIENLSADPAAGVAGRIIRNTTDGKVKIDTGSAYKAVLQNDGNIVIGTNGTPANNVRLHRGAAEVLQVVPGDNATAEGSLATTLAQLSAQLENYTDAGKPTFGNAGRIIWVTDLAQFQGDTGSAWSTLATSGVTFPSGSVSITGTASLAAIDSQKIVKITAQSGGYTITLPSHVANQFYWLKEVTRADVAANPITLARAGGTGNIEGVAASYVIRQNNFSFGIFDDGTDWHLL